jgi:hypothetical protein
MSKSVLLPRAIDEAGLELAALMAERKRIKAKNNIAKMKVGRKARWRWRRPLVGLAALEFIRSGSRDVVMVEPPGIEPGTSCMPCRRSPI